MDLFSAIFNSISNKRNRQANIQMTRETNEANLQIARETNALNQQIAREANAANAEQAELAYKRSLPVSQVANMMSAGMSKSGALSALSGGGSYTAPAAVTSQAQAATMQAPQGEATQIDTDIDGVIERAIASDVNATQSELLKNQIKDLQDDMQRKAAAEKRAQEAHDAAMDKEKYDKWTREKKDEFFSLLENTAQEKNLQPSENQSMHEYVRELGLQENELYKTLPASARTDAFNQYKQLQDEKRAQHDAEQRKIESHDKHRISVQTLKDMQAHAADFRSAKTARDKEYKVRALTADVNSIIGEMNLNKEQLRKEFEVYTRKDGTKTVQPHKGIQAFAKEFWETVGSVIGVEYVGDIVGRALGMLK